MKKSNLNSEELNRRCGEVFELQENDYIYDVEVDDDGTVKVYMEEVSQDGQMVIFDYEPDMTERPESLEYILGNRNDFND